MDSLVIVRNNRGKPVFEGTDIRADKIAEQIWAGRSRTEIMANFPSLPDGAFEASLEWDRSQRASQG